MVEIQAFLHGRFPRSEELVQATRDLDRARTTPDAVAAVRAKDRQALLAHQDKVGLSPVSDGQLAWQDSFRPIVESTQGLTVGPLTRYFDTNTFYKQPVLKARMFHEPLPDEAGPAYDGRPGVATLPGPHWCSATFEDEVWGNPINLVEAVTHEVLVKSAAAHVEAGARLVVLEEPSVPKAAADAAEGQAAPAAAEAVDRTIRAWRALDEATGDDVRTVVHFPFFDAAPVLDALDPSAAAFGVDLFQTDASDLEGRAFPEGLCVGAVDSRSYRLETADEVVDHLTRLLDAVETPWLGLTSTTHLEFLPADRALEKALVLGEAAARLQEEVA